jgi:hypothetical protein
MTGFTKKASFDFESASARCGAGAAESLKARLVLEP